MPTTMKRSKKKVKGNRFLFEQVEFVPINNLKPHPKNPNEGDIDAIRESLAENGMFRPLVVNRRNGLIAAGHHTWYAARAEGWEQIGVVYIDVDEDAHLRIMLADNKTADRRTYNEDMLDQILQSLMKTTGSVTGTGYTELDVEDIHTRAQEAASAALEGLSEADRERKQAELDLKRAKSFDGSDLGDEPDDEDDFDFESDGDTETIGSKKRDKDEDPIMDQPETMNGGLVQFKPPEDLSFPGSGELEIPKLSTDPDKLMTFDELPDGLLAWAGSATKDWENEDQWWLYNWGIDSTSGMRDISKVIVSFYCFDEYFDNWWWYPERYVAKLINSRIKYIVTTDYSMESKMSRAFAIWQLYRNRWLARYFQEAGLKIIPNISWKDGDELFLKKYVLGTLPKGLPLIAMQMQTIDLEKVDLDQYVKHLQLVLDTLEPQGLLLYVGKQADAVLKKLKIKCPVLKVNNRLDKLSEKAKMKKRKKTI